MPITTSGSTGIQLQFQNYFSKELLSIVQQETILDQFGMKAPIPKNNGKRPSRCSVSERRASAVFRT